MTKKTVYTVYDNGKPADNISYPMLSDLEHCWDNSSFDTLEEAQAYVAQWIGGDNPPHDLPLNMIYDYSGCGDVVEIRQEEKETE